MTSGSEECLGVPSVTGSGDLGWSQPSGSSVLIRLHPHPQLQHLLLWILANYPVPLLQALSSNLSRRNRRLEGKGEESRWRGGVGWYQQSRTFGEVETKENFHFFCLFSSRCLHRPAILKIAVLGEGSSRKQGNRGETLRRGTLEPWSPEKGQGVSGRSVGRGIASGFLP